MYHVDDIEFTIGSVAVFIIAFLHFDEKRFESGCSWHRNQTGKIFSLRLYILRFYFIGGGGCLNARKEFILYVFACYRMLLGKNVHLDFPLLSNNSCMVHVQIRCQDFIWRFNSFFHWQHKIESVYFSNVILHRYKITKNRILRTFLGRNQDNNTPCHRCLGKPVWWPVIGCTCLSPSVYI